MEMLEWLSVEVTWYARPRWQQMGVPVYFRFPFGISYFMALFLYSWMYHLKVHLFLLK